MKQYNKLVFITLLSLCFCCYGCSISDSSTANSNLPTVKLCIVFNKNIGGKPNDPMPDQLKKFIEPIEKDNIHYVPMITFARLDLDKDSVCQFEMPVSKANTYRKLGQTYDYTDMKNDYDLYMPSLQMGTYLTHSSKARVPNQYKFPRNSDDISFQLHQNGIRNNQDSILKEIDTMLFIKKYLPKRIIIYYNDSLPLKPDTSYADTTIKPEDPTKQGKPETKTVEDVKGTTKATGGKISSKKIGGKGEINNDNENLPKVINLHISPDNRKFEWTKTGSNYEVIIKDYDSGIETQSQDPQNSFTPLKLSTNRNYTIRIKSTNPNIRPSESYQFHIDETGEINDGKCESLKKKN